MVGRFALALGTTATVAACSLLAVASPGFAAETPLPVRSASLRQRGRRLIWKVSLQERLDTRRMRREHRSLCLLIERGRSGPIVSQLCLAPPQRRHHGARLLFARVGKSGAGRARAISATVTRPGARSLTASFLPSDIGLPYRPLRWLVQSSVEPPACLVSAEPVDRERAPAQTEPAPDAPNGAGEAQREMSCALVYPRRPRLARLHTPKLVGCVARGKSLVFGGPASRREIALTFDDGPWNDPPTMSFVNLLARYHVPATFFEIGEQISQYDPTGAIERKMLADGDMIGDHTWTHPVMTGLSPSQQRSQLESTAHAIRRATGFTPCLWRPPYGDTNGQLDSLARSLGLLTIYWSIDTRDWALPGVGAIEGSVISNARNGAIALMHFGGGPRQQTLSALPSIIAALRKRGYRFVTVAQMLGLKMIYR